MNTYRFSYKSNLNKNFTASVYSTGDNLEDAVVNARNKLISKYQNIDIKTLEIYTDVYMVKENGGEWQLPVNKK